MKKNMKKLIPLFTNISSMAIGVMLSRDNIMFYKVAMCIFFILWISTYTYLKD